MRSRYKDRTCRWTTMAAVLLLTASTALAQVAGFPPRDANDATQVDTGAIRGRVVDGHTKSPLSRVRVTLQGPGDLRRAIQTNESGVFAFPDLPAGMYLLTADKSTYLQGRYPESGHTLRTAPRPFHLLDRQLVDGVTISLFHGAAVSGRVIDSQGEPVEFATVQAMQVSRTGLTTSRGTTSTNDLGEFRIGRLRAGSYILLAQPRRNVQDDSQAPPPVPTFYPGVLARDQAVPITVERGASVTGLDLSLMDGVMSRLIGTLVSPSGRPASGGFVYVRAVLEGVSVALDTATAAVKPDGRFELKLAPGEYEIEGRSIRPGAVGPVQSGDEQFGMTRLTVTGEGRSDVTIVLGGGATVSGRVVFEGSTQSPPIPPNPVRFRISFASPAGSGCRSGRNDLGADWTFTVSGVFGTCLARVNSSLGELTVTAVRIADIDLLDQPLTFESGQQLRNVEVVVTNRQTKLNIQVADDRGQPTREYAALIFAIDKSRWAEHSRYIRSFVPAPLPIDQELDVTKTPVLVGALTDTPTSAPLHRDSITGLPQGEYYVVALDDLDSDAVRDPSVLESLSRSATRITLTDKAVVEVNLRRIKSPDQSISR